jgi:uncharacterized protein (TIGR01244 family)
MSMKSTKLALIAALALVGPALLALAGPGKAGHYVLAAQQVTKETRDGIKNFSRLETTVACAGAITSDAMPEIKKMGFASVINLREAQEPGADVDKHRAAAEAAGLRYYHVPFNGAKPDPKVADQFVKIISSKEAQPAFIHCASANRASAMWLIKRIVVDKWEVERAEEEAAALGLTNAALKQWAIEYARPDR